ncbi:uncharacterized protein [Hyperolius riggenbachi]|uniref:uncharacterized protein n=1 Tax=Hyperolius riggenbachi TaxID=752182 RepID=UPI0035A27047
MSGFRQCGHVLLWMLMFRVMMGEAEDPCNCFVVEDVSGWTLLMEDHCCVNISLSVDTVEWNMFTMLPNLRILDLSNSGIVEITDTARGKNITNIEFLYLNNNHLKELPDGFLSNAPNLKILHLEYNKLQRLPSDFLQVSDQIQEIDLNFNNLNSLPGSLLKPSLRKLNFLNNSLDCTCAMYDEFEPKLHNNDTSALLEDLICVSPKDVIGLRISEVERGRVCRSHSLTIALICIPLVAALLIGCWCVCCRKRKGSYTNTGRECSLVTVDRNGAGNLGDYHHYEPQQSFKKDHREPDAGQFKDPILLKPSAALLGSSRDLYEEVEIKLGTSADSLVDDKDQVGQDGPALMLAVEEEEEEEVEFKSDELEAETVSVTEVMKDSADREKLYLNQTTDYYSLVPGIELEDSDHCEYESVDLS